MRDFTLIKDIYLSLTSWFGIITGAFLGSQYLVILGRLMKMMSSCEIDSFNTIHYGFMCKI